MSPSVTASVHWLAAESADDKDEDTALARPVTRASIVRVNISPPPLPARLPLQPRGATLNMGIVGVWSVV